VNSKRTISLLLLPLCSLLINLPCTASRSIAVQCRVEETITTNGPWGPYMVFNMGASYIVDATHNLVEFPVIVGQANGSQQTLNIKQGIFKPWPYFLDSSTDCYSRACNIDWRANEDMSYWANRILFRSDSSMWNPYTASLPGWDKGKP